MIAVDTNILVLAHREESPLHAPARRRLSDLAMGDAAWAVPVFSLAEFVRVVTHPKIFDPPSTLNEALEAIEALLESETIRVLTPGAALNLNVFGRLSEDPRTLGDLTLQTGGPRNLLRTLLTACVSLGLLIKDGESYRNSPAAQRYLDPESDSYFGDYYRFQIDRQVYPAFESLDAALRGKAVHGLYTDAFEDPQRAADFFRGQHSGSLGPAFVLARQVELEGRRTVLDVGGGSGAFSIMLCNRFPRLTATIFDFPKVIEVSKTYVDEAGLTGRIRFAPGEAVSDDWPRGQDVVLMSYLLSAVDQQHHLPLMRKAWNCLAPGGLLLVHDFAVNDNGEVSLEAALWGLAMMIGNAGATNLSAGGLIAYGTETGFERVHVRPLIEGITSLLTCTKPGSAGLD